MASDPQHDARTALEAAIARAARALREDPAAAIQVPPPLTDEELAELEREEEELSRLEAEFYAAHPEVKRVSVSDYIIADRDRG